MNKEKNIVLIGMPGSGKTTFGKAVAQQLQRPFYDADDVVVELEGKTIKDMFAVSEDHFRDAESRAVKVLAEKTGIVIACGGGVVKRQSNIKTLRKTGTIIFIDRKPEAIIADVDADSRPLLAAGRQKIYDLYAERIALYREAADYTIANDTASADVVSKLIHMIETW